VRDVTKFLVLLTATLFFAGCKLAVVVVEGGEVHSLDYGACSANSICIIEVDDTIFADYFWAIPQEGWYFKQWNSGESFFCGGSIDRGCILTFDKYAETEAAQAMVESSETFYLMPVFKQRGECPAPSGDIEWLQPADFVGYTHDEIAAICSPSSGLCSGFLPRSNFDLTGYTWASESDIGSLYCEYGFAPPHHVRGEISDSRFFDDFRPTNVAERVSSREVVGLLRERDSVGRVIGFSDSDDATFGIVTSSFLENIGAWFWLPR
jgi:hypothetical protein